MYFLLRVRYLTAKRALQVKRKTLPAYHIVAFVAVNRVSQDSVTNRTLKGLPHRFNYVVEINDVWPVSDQLSFFEQLGLFFLDVLAIL